MKARSTDPSTTSAWTVFALGALAVVFAVGLSFAAVELPRLVSSWLIETFEFPRFDSGRQVAATETWLRAHGVRIVGYASFGAVLLAVFVGLLCERRRVATAGAVALLLPIFGHFAASMFFLAGLGMLRVVVLPILDRSYRLMALGDVAYIPYMILVYPAAVMGFDARAVVIWSVMALGMGIFVLGVAAWFLARVRGQAVADRWVYRVSRHPQYVGWILWSCGLMLYVSRYSELYHFKISYGVPSSLPWLLSTMVIVGVALSEEVAMGRQPGNAYCSYAKGAAFLFPVPRAVARIVAAPMRLALGKPWPESGADVLRTVSLYTAVLILLSVPFVVFGWPAVTGWWAFPYNVPPFVPAG